MAHGEPENVRARRSSCKNTLHLAAQVLGSATHYWSSKLIVEIFFWIRCKRGEDIISCSTRKGTLEHWKECAMGGYWKTLCQTAGQLKSEHVLNELGFTEGSTAVPLDDSDHRERLAVKAWDLLRAVLGRRDLTATTHTHGFPARLAKLLAANEDDWMAAPADLKKLWGAVTWLEGQSSLARRKLQKSMIWPSMTRVWRIMVLLSDYDFVRGSAGEVRGALIHEGLGRNEVHGGLLH